LCFFILFLRMHREDALGIASGLASGLASGRKDTEFREPLADASGGK